MHSSVIGKIEKAHRYARERDRITVEGVQVTFRGDNDKAWRHAESFIVRQILDHEDQ